MGGGGVASREAWRGVGEGPRREPGHGVGRLATISTAPLGVQDGAGRRAKYVGIM